MGPLTAPRCDPLSIPPAAFLPRPRSSPLQLDQGARSPGGVDPYVGWMRPWSPSCLAYRELVQGHTARKCQSRIRKQNSHVYRMSQGSCS